MANSGVILIDVKGKVDPKDAKRIYEAIDKALNELTEKNKKESEQKVRRLIIEVTIKTS